MGDFFEKFGEYILKGFVWLWIYLTPAHDYYTSIFLLLSVDMFFGIWKARKRLITITIKKALYPFIIKVIGYGVLISLAVNLDKTLATSWISEQVAILNIIGVSIIFIELKSILQNVSIITGADLWITIKDKLAEALKVTPKEDIKADE